MLAKFRENKNWACFIMLYNISHGDAPAYHCDMLPQTVGDWNYYNLCSSHKMYIYLLQGFYVIGDHLFLLLFVNGISLLTIL